MEFPNAEAGDVLELVRVPPELADVIGAGRLLRLVGSEPPEYRSLNLGRCPEIKINNQMASLLQLYENSTPWVACRDEPVEVAMFQNLLVGTKIEVVSQKTLEQVAADKREALERVQRNARRGRGW